MARGQLEESAREEERRGRGQWSPAATFLAAARASDDRSGDGEVRELRWTDGGAGELGFRPSRPDAERPGVFSFLARDIASDCCFDCMIQCSAGNFSYIYSQYPYIIFHTYCFARHFGFCKRC